MKTLALSTLPWLLPSFAALAAAPVPLPVTPVRAMISVQAGPCSPDGTSSAFVSGSLGGGDGTISASLSIAASDATASISGSSINSFGLDVRLQIEVDVSVPEIGQATTPVFVSLEDVVTPASGHIEYIALEPGRMVSPCGTEDKLARPDSELLAADVGTMFDETAVADGFAFYGKPPQTGSVLPGIRRGVVPHAFPGGDVVHLPIVAHVFLTSNGGPYSGSFRVVFRTAPVTLGSGDVNGDGNVNVLDVTLIRRAIAGLPP